MANQNKLRKLENKKIELVRKLQLCEHYKEKIVRFVQELNNQHNQGLINHEEYYYKLNRALEQRTPEQWIKYYNGSIDYYKYKLNIYDKEIKKQENIAKIVPAVTILTVFMILGFGFLFLKPAITGLIVGIGEEAYTQDISLIVNESSVDEWQLEQIGILRSFRVDGKILGNGSVKIYLDDKLVLDSSKLEKSGISMITGLAIGNLTETNNSVILSENITENITALEVVEIKNVTNITQEVPENITIVEENVTAPVPELVEVNITEIIFTDVCIETCSLNLNKTSYELRFEIENAILHLDSISYTIKPIEIPEVPKPVEKVSKVEETIQEQAEINKPVKWTKSIVLDETVSNLTVKLPKNISDVKVNKIKDKVKEEISSGKLKIREAKQIKEHVEKKTEEETELIIEEDVKEVEIEYYTKAPEVMEEYIGDYKKQIIVSSDIHYENILAYTSIRESQKEAVKLYWLVNDSRKLVSDVSYIDTNNNGLIDRIEWIVPSLSNQTYEVIIEISKAEHLDENHSFISDIYDKVKELDNIWSKGINNEEYVRVTFEQNLTSNRDITIYPRVINGNPKIEVYEFNGTDLIAEFTNISSNKYNTIYLTNLQGQQDVFDLKVINGTIELDHIIDPLGEQLENPSFTGGSASWTLSVATYDSATYQDTAGSMQVYAARKATVTGTATQDDYDDYLSTDTVNFSCYWKNTQAGNGDIQFFAEIAEQTTPTSWTEIWSSSVLSASNDWTNTGNIDVSSYFSTGTYRLRLRIEATGGAAVGSEEYGWFDNCSLFNTPLNTAPTIQVQNIFINCSAGHCFNVTAGVSDADGGTDIVKTNISTTSGTCEHYSNTTNGNYFNVTFNCSGTALQSTDIIIGFNDSFGAYVNSTLSSNTYPDQAPTDPTDIAGFPANLYVGDSLTVSASGGSDADGDTITDHFKFYNVNESVTRQDWSATNSYTIQTSDVHDTIRVYAKSTTTYTNSSGSYYEDDFVDDTIPTDPTDLILTAGDVRVTDSLTGTCTDSTDADSDSIIYHYEFYNTNDTTTRQAYSATNSYTIAVVDAHDQIRVRCKAVTDYGESSGYDEENKQITDTLPTLTNPTINDTSPKTDSILKCDAGTYDDADDDSQGTSNWKWFKNTIVISGETSRTLNLSVAGNGDNGDNIICSEQPTNTYGIGLYYNSSSVTIQNTAPEITNISDIPAQSITEAGISYVEFFVLASDVDEVGDLNDASLNATFTRTGEETRFNSSCSWVSDINTTTANYTCTIGIWYWDGAGTWDVNATILDLSSAQSAPYGETFTLQETTAMVMSPTALTWPSINLTSTNVLSDSDPIIINNTANKDIADGYVNVTAIDLQGQETTTDFIYAGNFTVNINDACEGTIMANNTAIAVSGATITAGNNSKGDGQEDLYFCLEEVPSGISSQTYSTTGLGSWIISVS